MPNHIHAIVFIDGEKRANADCRDEACLVSTGKDTRVNEKMQQISHGQNNLSVTIGGFKSAITKFANENDIDFAWQSRFHDRILRNQDEMNRINDYIENNPARWDDDCFNKSVFV